MVLMAWLLPVSTEGKTTKVSPETGNVSIFDFSKISVTPSTRMKLNGNWCFHWQQFIKPNQACSQGASSIPLPSKWNQLDDGFNRYPRQGFASYSAIILLPNDAPQLGLFVPILYRAADVFINGERVLRIGKPGKNKQNESPRDARYLIPLPTDTNRLELVVHISSFHHIDGGMNKVLEIAPFSVLESEERIRMLTSIFLVGSSLSFALYFFFMGMGPAVKGDLVYVMGAASILTYTIRVIGTEQVWLWIDPIASALWILRCEYYGLVLSFPAFLYYLHYLLPGVVNSLVCKITLAIGITSALFISLTPVEVFAWMRDPWVGLYIVSVMYYIYCIAKAIYRRLQDALLIGVIVIAVIFTTINDLFLWFNLVNGSPMVNFTYFSLLLGNVSVLTMRMIRSANRENILSKEIQELNIGLQKKVDERTQELAQQVEEVDQQRQIAERANAAKSNFLAIASHDLRQPLHALGLFIGSLRFTNKPQEREEVQEKLEMTHGSLTELFDALLDISKIDAGALEINAQIVALKPLLLKVMNDFSVTASKKNILLKMYARDLYVETDPIWLERILRNLLSNALRYTSTGSVIICLRSQQGKAKIQVLDTGIGIAESNIEDVFEEFTQLKTPMPQGRLGLGLGLSIVQKLCKLLDHSVTVASKVGKGSVFTVGLGQCVKPMPPVAPTLLSNEFNQLEGKVILVADDEQEVRVAMQMMLEKWGVRVIQAESKAQVLEILRSCSHLPDLLITDYRFADQYTGLDIVKEIKDQFSTPMPVLMVTAETSAEKVKMFKEAGVRVLHKPVQQAKIRMMLNFLCGKIS